MANDVSYFRVQGDNTTYSFNDQNLESQVFTINELLGSDTMGTTAATITGAIAELNSRINAMDGGGVLFVGATVSGNTTTLDKTYAEIAAADASGKVVVLQLEEERQYLIWVGEDSGTYYVGFVGSGSAWYCSTNETSGYPSHTDSGGSVQV